MGFIYRVKFACGEPRFQIFTVRSKQAVAKIWGSLGLMAIPIYRISVINSQVPRAARRGTELNSESCSNRGNAYHVV